MTVHNTCLSFILGMDVAANFLATGRYRNILVVSTEVASCGINPREPEAASLVGDAAAAVVVTHALDGEASAVHRTRFKTYGEGAYMTTIMGGGSHRHPRFAGHDPNDDLFHMDGPAVLRLVREHAEGFHTLEWLGNCVSASIPSTLYQAVQDGHVSRGKKVLLVGTGAGLSLGGMILTY
jgi:3-oxoacyl-[acyl-carrier-protein] synthase-3